MKTNNEVINDFVIYITFGEYRRFFSCLRKDILVPIGIALDEEGNIRYLDLTEIMSERTTTSNFEAILFDVEGTEFDSIGARKLTRDEFNNILNDRLSIEEYERNVFKEFLKLLDEQVADASEKDFKEYENGKPEFFKFQFDYAFEKIGPFCDNIEKGNN
ncbi:MAG: hypothetical protein N4A44_03240 [Alphaproteobacteria bacterium]|jgi:lipoprotein NlpI|nr:hypothetical protein [Alphaproteobacteria bacterium]